MIDTKKLTLLDTLGYSLDEIKDKVDSQIWESFSKWFGNKPYYMSTSGKKCILKADLQMYIRLKTNLMKAEVKKQ